METLDEARDFWQNTNQESNPPLLVREDMENVIKSRIKKEKKGAAEYFWLSFAFQILIYSFACHLIIKYWGDGQMMVLSACGALLYIPLTILLMSKFKAFFDPSAERNMDVRTAVKKQFEFLNQFFRFKKSFDLVSIPLNSVILTGILFKLYVPGGIDGHLARAATVCLPMMLIYSAAAWHENKKHFIRPLHRLGSILMDMQNPG